jgi:hypothetical protein
MTDYHYKYLKYKEKYMKLRKMVGGVEISDVQYESMKSGKKFFIFTTNSIYLAPNKNVEKKNKELAISLIQKLIKNGEDINIFLNNFFICALDYIRRSQIFTFENLREFIETITSIFLEGGIRKDIIIDTFNKIVETMYIPPEIEEQYFILKELEKGEGIPYSEKRMIEIEKEIELYDKIIKLLDEEFHRLSDADYEKSIKEMKEIIGKNLEEKELTFLHDIQKKKHIKIVDDIEKYKEKRKMVIDERENERYDEKIKGIRDGIKKYHFEGLTLDEIDKKIRDLLKRMPIDIKVGNNSLSERIPIINEIMQKL